MSRWRWKPATVVVTGMLLLNLAPVQSQPTIPQIGQSDRLSIVYAPYSNSGFQEVYDLLRQHRALENIREILSPFRLSEQLTIEATECGAVNSYYQRKNFKPTVTICYEFLERVLELLPNQTTPTDSLQRMRPSASFSG